MIAAWVIALTCSVLYGVLARCAPHTAGDLAVLFAVVIVSAWAFLALRDRRPR